MIRSLILKYKWKLFWKFRSLSTAKKYIDNTKLEHRATFVNILSKYKMKSLLEIGCGNGANIWVIQNQYNNNDVSYTGVDISPAAIELAKSREYDNKNVEFYKDDAIEFLKKSDTLYDVILVDAVLMYMTESEVKKILNILYQKGKLIILSELASSSVMELNENGFIHNYEKILTEVNMQFQKSKPKRTDPLWKMYGCIFVIQNGAYGNIG